MPEGAAAALPATSLIHMSLTSRLRQNRKSRLLLVLGVLCFLGCYQWAYIHWVSPTFASYGFDYNPVPMPYVILAWVLSILPSLWMPLQLTRPSHLAYWVLYLTVIIPSMFIPLYIGLSKPSEVAAMMVVLFIGFAITGLSNRWPLFSVRYRAVSSKTFWRWFWYLAIASAITVVIAFRHNVRLVSFGEIYDIRSESGDIAAGGGVINYALMWLYGAISPFLVARGMFYRQKWLLLAGILGEVLVYASFGTKASLLSVVFIGGFYFLLRKGPLPFSLRLVGSLVALYAALILAYVLAADGEWEFFVGFFLFLVFLRTFGLAGLLTGQYYYFFQVNPHTYYSHLKPVALFMSYPYHYPLGTEIGYYFYDPLVDTTAHVWATDGIAAWGLFGILLVSVFCAILFWTIDSIAQKHDPRFSALVLSYAVYNMGNLSVFTTLLSGGLALLILFLYLMPKQNEPLDLKVRGKSSDGVGGTSSPAILSLV